MTDRPAMPRRGLYWITAETTDTNALRRRAEAVLRGGAVLVQYRDKSADTSRRREQAAMLCAVCAARGVALLVNDDVALAAAVGAAGVHLGEDDGSIAHARGALGPGAIVGVSCYDDLARAQALAAQGADYLAFGAFFPTATKPLTRRATPALLREAARFGLPRVAIGGITPDKAPPLVAAGADQLAAVGGQAGAADAAVLA
ncbi:MAG: thiamine phosphate synthase, partial [Pseudomonadota bacterium]